MNQSRPIVLAYVACWSKLDAAQVDAKYLTHLNYAFACIHDGQVVNFMAANFDRLSAGDPALAALGFQAACAEEDAGLGLVRALKAGHPRLKALISVGGWAAEGFSDAALSEAGRERLADSAVRFMLRHGFDGVELAWQYPCSALGGIRARPEDRDNFTALLALLRTKLDACSLSEGRSADARYLLSIAAGAARAQLDGIDVSAIAPLLDFIGLMSYDLYDGWSTRAGHHTNLFCSRLDPHADSADNAVRMFTAAGAPASKLLIGAALYGRGMSGVPAQNDGLLQPSAPGSNLTRTYDEIRALLQPPTAWVRHWDEQAQAAFLYDGASFISYDDEQSLQSKARYVLERGLAGAMFWEYSNDRSGELLRALASTLSAERATAPSDR